MKLETRFNVGEVVEETHGYMGEIEHISANVRQNETVDIRYTVKLQNGRVVVFQQEDLRVPQ